MRCGAVIPAAGQAQRFGDGDKTLRTLAGRPLIEWTIRALIDSRALSEIVIVVSESNQSPILDLIAGIKPPLPISTVLGGDLRMDSVRTGVRALNESCDLALIHDAARPLVGADLIRDTIDTARATGAAIPGVPVTDTVKNVVGGQVVRTLDRSELMMVQTPQVFRRNWLVEAYESLTSTAEATDEASIIEEAGHPVRVIPGDPSNLKVTTLFDARIAEALLQERASAL